MARALDVTMAAAKPPATASNWRRWLDPLHIALVVVTALVVVYVVLCIQSGRFSLLDPKPIPKPHVVAHFTGTIVILSQDSTEGCVTRPGHRGHLCASIYAHQPLTVGQRIAMVEVVVPASDGNVTTVLVINPTS